MRARASVLLFLQWYVTWLFVCLPVPLLTVNRRTKLWSQHWLGIVSGGQLGCVCCWAGIALLWVPPTSERLPNVKLNNPDGVSVSVANQYMYIVGGCFFVLLLYGTLCNYSLMKGCVCCTSEVAIAKHTLLHAHSKHSTKQLMLIVCSSCCPAARPQRDQVSHRCVVSTAPKKTSRSPSTPRFEETSKKKCQEPPSPHVTQPQDPFSSGEEVWFKGESESES